MLTVYAVIGLDLSLTCTGVALPDGTVDQIVPGKRSGLERLEFIRAAVQEIALRSHTDEAYEDPVFAIEGLSFGSKNAYAHEIGGLGYLIRWWMWNASYEFYDVPPKTLKAYATGKGNASKDEVLVAAVKRLGYDGSSTDIADALWLRACVSDVLGQPTVEVPAAHRKFLDRLALVTGGG